MKQVTIPSDWNKLTKYGRPSKRTERKPRRKNCRKCKLPFKSDIPTSKGVRLICLDGSYDEVANKLNYEHDRKIGVCDCEAPPKPNEAMAELMLKRIGPNPTKLQRKKFRRIPGYSCV